MYDPNQSRIMFKSKLRRRGIYLAQLFTTAANCARRRSFDLNIMRDWLGSYIICTLQ